MGDPYDNRDHRFDDESGKRRRRQRRYMREEDAWGAAHYGDEYDGDAADFEDWAAMVPEESYDYPERDIWIEEPGGNVNSYVPYSGQDPQEAARRAGRNNKVVDDLSTDSPAMRRARQLRARYSRNITDRANPPGPGPLPYRNHQNPPVKQERDFFDALFNFEIDDLFKGGGVAQTVTIAVFVLLIAAAACIGAAWVTASELRDTLGMTEWIYFLGL